jgi:hypothetical protein
MKTTLLVIAVFVSALAQATETDYEHIVYELSAPVDFAGTDNNGWAYINFKRQNDGFRIVDTNVEVSTEQALEAADRILPFLFSIDEGSYVPGFLENYPNKPDSEETYSQFGYEVDLISENYQLVAAGMVEQIKARLQGENIIYESEDGVHVVEVTDERVLLTNGHSTFNGFNGDKIYSCPASFIDPGLSLMSNLADCVVTDYKSSVAGWLGGWHESVNDIGYSVTRSISNKTLKVIEPSGVVFETEELPFDPGRAYLGLFISSGDMPYVFVADDENYKSHVYRYRDGGLHQVDQKTFQSIIGLEPLDERGFILGGTSRHLVFFNDNQELSICEKGEAKSSDLNYQDVLQLYAQGWGEGFVKLISSYPNKPEDYEQIIVDYDMVELFPSGLNDDEFQSTIDGYARPVYDDVVAANGDILGCIPGSTLLVSEKAIPMGIYERSGEAYVFYQRQIHESGSNGSYFHNVPIFFDLKRGIKRYPSQEIRSALGEDHPYIVLSKTAFSNLYPSVDTESSVFSDSDLAAMEIALGTPQADVSAFISAALLQMTGSNELKLAPSPVHITNGWLHYHAGRLKLSPSSNDTVIVTVKPESDVIDSYSNATSFFDVMIEGDHYAADISCSIDGALDITAAEYGNWGGIERLTLPIEWTNRHLQGAASLKGNAAAATDEQRFLSADILAQLTTGEAIIDCTATVSDQFGGLINATVVPATVKLDDGIHGGAGIISGSVSLPAGIAPEQVTVKATINGRTITVNVDANGDFAFANLRAGDFTVSVHSERYVQACVNAVVNGEITELGEIQLVAGDINNDNEINIADVTLLASHYGALLGDANYSASADLNVDERINVQDLAILASHFGAQQCID